MLKDTIKAVPIIGTQRELRILSIRSEWFYFEYFDNGVRHVGWAQCEHILKEYRLVYEDENMLLRAA
jgi:hypothetical protein